MSATATNNRAPTLSDALVALAERGPEQTASLPIPSAPAVEVAAPAASGWRFGRIWSAANERFVTAPPLAQVVASAVIGVGVGILCHFAVALVSPRSRV